MDRSIEKKSAIDRRQLQTNQYVQSLLREGAAAGLISPDDLDSFRVRLTGLLAHRVALYSGMDSTSVRTEKARDILSSTLYTLDAVLKANPSPDEALKQLLTTDLDELFSQGRRITARLLNRGKSLLSQVRRTLPTSATLALRDTVGRAFDQFFSTYDADFSAFMLPEEADYPLLLPVSGLSGVENAANYLARLLIENQFCRALPDQETRAVWLETGSNFDQSYENIARVLLLRLLIRGLAGRDMTSLLLAPADLDAAHDSLRRLPEGQDGLRQLRGILGEMAADLCQSLALGDYAKRYFRQAAAAEAAPLLNAMQNDALQSFFLINFASHTDGPVFCDNEAMSNRAFRRLIQDVLAADSPDQKVDVILKNAKSLADLTDLLAAECLFDDEYDQLFLRLDAPTLLLLRQQVLEGSHEGKPGQADSPPRSWHAAFCRFWKVLTEQTD